MYNLEGEEPEGKKERSFEDKAMAAMLSFFALAMIIFVIVIVWSILVAFWQAGFFVTIIWVAVFSVLFLAGKFIYKIIIHNDWVDRV